LFERGKYKIKILVTYPEFYNVKAYDPLSMIVPFFRTISPRFFPPYPSSEQNLPLELDGPVVAHTPLKLESNIFDLIDDGELITRAAHVQIPNN
jgi:hypothetical protein